MKLFRFIGRRLVYCLILILAVIVLNFLLIHLAPGDPVETIAGEMGGASQELMDEIRKAYGLDKPLSEQLFTYIKKTAHGDLGYSYYFDRPVLELIGQRVPATLILVLCSLFLAMFLGTFMGVVASYKPNGFFSHFLTMFALIGYSVPVFWLGIMMLIVFASALPMFPVSGMYDVKLASDGAGSVVHFLDILYHLILPMVTLAIIYIAQYSRLARASMVDVLGSDYIRTAKAKGLSKPVIFFKHALRNAVLPVVTMAGLQMGYLFSGAVLVETVFNWPGLGRLAFQSILRRDYPTILGILIFSTFMVIAANLLTDLSYRLIDPRIRDTAN